MRRIGEAMPRFVLPAIVLLSLQSVLLGQITVTASLDARQVLVNDSFTWTLEVEGSSSMPSVRLGDIDKIAFLSGPMQSSNYSIVNGKTSSKKTITYTFLAMEAGDVVFPSIDVMIGGERYRTEALKLEILASRDSQRQGGQASQQVFLKAIPSKTEVFVGEPLTVEYKLFTKVGVYNYQVEKLPDAVGFWAEEVPSSTQPRLVSEIVEGVRYNTAVLKTVIYYPTKSGELVIDPLKTELEIEVKSNQRNSRRFSDPFFNDPFFSGNRKANKDFLSNPLVIKVQSLPEPRPRNFSGAVGQFQIKANLDTNAVFANDAVGLNITLSGSGNFKSIQIPDPVLPEGIDMFKPERSESVSIRNMRHSGSKRSTYLLVPRVAGELALDPIEFSYFDPSAKRYVKRSTGPLGLRVLDAEGTRQVITSGYSREEVELMQEDIRYIKSAETRFITPHAKGLGWGFWAVHLAGMLALGAALAYQHRTNRLEGDRDLQRRTMAISQARKKLKQAEKLAEDSPELRALLNQCITGFIGARSTVAENRLDTEDLLAVLQKRGIEAEIIDQTRRFLEGLAMDRFAPGAVRRSAGEWIHETQELFSKLRRVL